MQDTKMNMGEYVLFSVPMEMLEEAGIGEESVIHESRKRQDYYQQSKKRRRFCL